MKLKENIGRLDIRGIGMVIDQSTPPEKLKDLVKKFPHLSKYMEDGPTKKAKAESSS